MMRLNEPECSALEVLCACCDGITGNAALLEKLKVSKPALVDLGDQYRTVGKSGQLYTIEPVDDEIADDPPIVNELRKSELIRIYSQYLVPESKPARRVYDSLLNAAEEKCPFCGGIGTPRNLDHFLPKAHFPQFSLLPLNLIPSCRDCNFDGKSQIFATIAQDQLIQPYIDKDIFFDNQWIFAIYNSVNPNEPGEFEYFVKAPLEWDVVDKERINKHFQDFGIAKRYGTKAGESLGTVLKQIKNLRSIGLDDATITQTILQPGVDSAPFLNHWQKGMYKALIEAVNLGNI